ncbi:hypothetical protein FT809_RS25585 [Escherichia coli]|nr:hypothetical protein [Escherichia coli]EES5276391.1 hypothetical protein [Escherichia coli]EES8575979.1 hypothetical protein [Escherichia coli]
MMMRLDVASTGATTMASYEPIAQIWDIINQHPIPEMVNIMCKHQRKHTKQAISRDYRNRMGESITVIFKRPVTPLRAMLVDDMEQRWDEIRLAHELRKFI